MAGEDREALMPGFHFKLRPTGPWRIGPANGDRRQVDPVYHSDALYSAVTSAMLEFGLLEDWLAATASAEAAAVRFSSCFPWLGDARYVAPPRHLWPIPATSRMRWKGARFVPLPLAADLVAGKAPNENKWTVDGASGCLLPQSAAAGPFRASLRSRAAVDRLLAGVEVHSSACLEFVEDAGLWGAVSFSDADADAKWSPAVRGAIRLLADSGFGGGRSRGWGRSAPPEFVEGDLPGMAPEEGETAHWLLSLFSPAANDAVDWQRGSYALVARTGRVESRVSSGETKKPVQMVEEGSVLVAAEAPRGAAVDVAPDGFPHPVYRFGAALSIPIPWQAAA